MIVCLRQLQKVGDIQKQKGDCFRCTADKKNRDCPGYIPFNLFKVEEKHNANTKREVFSSGQNFENQECL